MNDATDTPADVAAPVEAPRVVPPLSELGKNLDRKAAARDRARKRAEKRERDAAAARARRAAKKSPPPETESATPGASPAATDDAPGSEAPPQRTDEQRAEDGSRFLVVFYKLAGALAGLFGWEVEPLSEKDAAADAALLVPLARRFLWLDLLLTWFSPLALAHRFMLHLHRRQKAGNLVALPSPPSSGEERQA